MIRIAYAAHLPSIEEIIDSNQDEEPIARKRTLKAHQIKNPEDIGNLLLSEKEVLLYHHFSSDVEIIEFKHNSLEIKLLDNAPKNFAMQLKQFLSERLNDKWEVLSHEGIKKGYTLAQKAKQAEEEEIKRIKESEAVQQVLNTFTELEIIDIKVNG
jgi:DNA polymerase-3 subunit gamma/tau